jgi:ribosomal protein S16
MTQARIERDRLDHWVGRGAQLSVSLAKVLREQAKAASPAS